MLTLWFQFKKHDIFWIMIKASNIVKCYGDLRVLDGVSVAIDNAEVVAIVGASGAGKTTMLQILGTLDRPQQGQVTYDGVDVLAMRERELARFRNQHIGFVFQFHQLLPEFTMLENVAIPALIGGAKRADAYRRATELLEFMGLADRLDHKPSQLSGGECQRVAVARALVNKPRVVLADEPSGSLDTANKRELHSLFFKIRDEFGSTFVIVTHDEELAAGTDRIIHLKDGKIIGKTA